ncbi:hypothetical protein HDK77DRAFT_268881 [Phyllosticta capitalensis]
MLVYFRRLRRCCCCCCCCCHADTLPPRTPPPLALLTYRPTQTFQTGRSGLRRRGVDHVVAAGPRTSGQFFSSISQTTLVCGGARADESVGGHAPLTGSAWVRGMEEKDLGGEVGRRRAASKQASKQLQCRRRVVLQGPAFPCIESTLRLDGTWRKAGEAGPAGFEASTICGIGLEVAGRQCVGLSSDGSKMHMCPAECD